MGIRLRAHCTAHAVVGATRLPSIRNPHHPSPALDASTSPVTHSRLPALVATIGRAQASVAVRQLLERQRWKERVLLLRVGSAAELSRADLPHARRLLVLAPRRPADVGRTDLQAVTCAIVAKSLCPSLPVVSQMATPSAAKLLRGVPSWSSNAAASLRAWRHLRLAVTAASLAAANASASAARQERGDARGKGGGDDDDDDDSARSGQDAAICTVRLKAQLLAAGCLHPGLPTLLCNLLLHREDTGYWADGRGLPWRREYAWGLCHSVYTVPLTLELRAACLRVAGELELAGEGVGGAIGMPCLAAALFELYGATPLGLRCRADGRIVLYGSGVRVRYGDVLFVVTTQADVVAAMAHGRAHPAAPNERARRASQRHGKMQSPAPGPPPQAPPPPSQSGEGHGSDTVRAVSAWATRRDGL